MTTAASPVPSSRERLLVRGQAPDRPPASAYRTRTSALGGRCPPGSEGPTSRSGRAARGRSSPAGGSHGPDLPGGPITPGKTQDARDFMRELEEKRKPDYDRSERRIAITKEAWYLARTPGGDQFVACMETPDFGQALSCSPGRRTSSTCGSSAAWPTPPALTSTPRPPGRCPSSYRAIPHRRSPRHRRATKASAGIWAGTAAQLPQRAERPSRPPAWSS